MPDPGTPIRVIDNPTELIEVCDNLKDQSLIGVDTEFNRTKTYRPQLCLIQLATPARVDCIDVLAEMDLAPLHAALAEDPGLKVLHAAKQDLEAFQLTFGLLPAPILDTQIAAGLLHYPPQISYAALVENLLGIHLDKAETRTDWSRRSLTAAQISYAATDVLHLARLHEKLQAALTRLGRYQWALEDSAALLDTTLYDSPPEEAWRRLSGIPYLPVPEQARARRLAAWREARANRIDRPRQWILPDKALMAIAVGNPRDEKELSRLTELPPGMIRRQGQRILEEIRRASEQVQHGTTEFRRETKPPAPDTQTIKRLGGIVRQVAGDLGMSPEILATRKELAALLHGKRDLRVLSGWRKEIIGDSLLAEAREHP